MSNKTGLTANNLALISVFSALYIALNLTLAPLSFRILGIPVVHGAIVFFLLLLVVWVTGKYGAASIVGIIGGVIVLLAGGPLPVISFAVAALLFDAILLACQHQLSLRPRNIAIVILATAVCSYLAGVMTGILFTQIKTLQFALTIWGIWTMIGGVLGFAASLPIIGLLEKANVKRIKT